MYGFTESCMLSMLILFFNETGGGEQKLGWLGGEQDEAGPCEVDCQRLPQVLASALLRLGHSSDGGEHLPGSPLPHRRVQRGGGAARLLHRHQPARGSHLHLGQVGDLLQTSISTTFRFTVKLLSYDRTNDLLANLTSGDHTMPPDLQGFSIERIRRVRIWILMNMKLFCHPYSVYRRLHTWRKS